MYVVDEKHSFLTARGVIGPGEEIRESDFAKKETFLKKVSTGSIVAGKSKAQLEKEAADKKAAAEKEQRETDAKKLQEAKEKAVADVTVAETALAKAREAQTAARETANKISQEIAGRIKPQVSELEQKIQNCEKAAKDAQAAFDKANPDQKDAAGNNLKLAAESLDAAKKELEKVMSDSEGVPELKAALQEAERTADAVIDAEANLAEAQIAAAKVK